MYKEESDSEPEVDKSEYVPGETEEEIEKLKIGKNSLLKKEKIIFLNTYITMQREISDKVFLGNTVSPFKDAGRSSAIDRTLSNYNDAKEKFQKMRELIKTGQYDEDIAQYIPGLLQFKFHGMLEDRY